MSEPAAAIAALARQLIAIIAKADAEPPSRFTEFSRLLAPLSALPEMNAPPPPGGPLPVCRHLDEALAGVGASRLGATLAALARFLSWTQNPNYRRDPPTSRFLQNYGYAVIAGPKDGAPALARHPDLALGILLLGPRTEYPAHHHPAAEIYVPLGLAEWTVDAGPWLPRAAGNVIHHPPNLVHATRTDDAPLAALYLWNGDLATDARLVNGDFRGFRRESR